MEMTKKRSLNEIRQTKDSVYRAPRSHELIVNTESKPLPEGWWLHITPLARLDPEEWILGVMKRGKKAWITEMCKNGFSNPQEAYNWGIEFINKKIDEA